VASIQWDRAVGGHLKRAADANSVELAKQELEVVVKYLDEHNIKTGYTSVFWTTPDEDVGFWYTNITTCLNQLKALPEHATQGEKDMVLMKLRQTLLDHKGGHETVTEPSGIHLFPSNGAFAGVFAVTLMVALCGCCFFLYALSEVS
jgi:hypothetical protein